MAEQNEAAELLRGFLEFKGYARHASLIYDALAIERRAGRLQALGECMCKKCEPEWTAAILDEEASRKVAGS